MINPWDRKGRSGKSAHMRKFHDGVEKDIEAYGRRIICVGPTEAEPPTSQNDFFAYTVGNARRSLPELLIIGTSRGGYILNPLSEMMIERGQKFADGEMVECGCKFPFCLIDASETVKDRYTIQAGEHYNSQDYPVMQVVLPDTGGLFPWQPGCTSGYEIYRLNLSGCATAGRGIYMSA
jgi:Domain of unknown function (DUF4262)